MNDYKLPVPSTALILSPKLVEGPQRLLQIVCIYFDEVLGTNIKLILKFESVRAYRVTYDGAVTAEEIHAAYDRVVNLGRTEWLEYVHSNLARNKRSPRELNHFCIYFDDGPLFEFICENFTFGENESFLPGS